MDLLPLSGQGSFSACARAEAVARLRGHGPSAWYRAWLRGPLCATFALQVPYRLFEVRVWNAGRLRRDWLAVDAASGLLDLYRFEGPPAPDQLQRDGHAGVAPEALAPERLRAVLEERVRRQVYAAGFFRLRGLRIEVDDAHRVLYVPYWVGVHRKRGRVHLEVLDALRRSREGARLRHVLAGQASNPSAKMTSGNVTVTLPTPISSRARMPDT